MSEKAPSTSQNSESYADSLRNRVGDYRTDGPVLDESERIRRKMGIESDTTEQVDTNAEAETLREFAEGDVVHVKSMNGDPEVRGTIKEFVVDSIYTTPGGTVEVKLLSTDGKEDQRIAYSALQKNALDAPANSTPESIEVASTSDLRPVEDGEFDDSYLTGDPGEQNTNPEDEDYLPVGPMLHEPWTTAEEASSTTPEVGTGNPDTTAGETDEEDLSQPGTDFEVVADETGSEATNNTERPDGVYSRRGSDLFNGGRETPGVQNTETAPVVPGNATDPHPEYDGPVESGAEIELAGPTDIEVYNPGPTDIEVYDPGTSEVQQLPEVDPALIERLDLARSKYAELTAKSRKSYLGRFFKPDTQIGGVIGKIPGMQKMVSAWNSIKASSPVQSAAEGMSSLRKFNADTEVAKQNYEEAYTALSEATAAELERIGWEEDVVASLSLIGNIAQDAQLEEEILHQRQAQAKSTNKLVNWWVSQQGIKGKLKKAGVVLAAGAATGLTAGMFAGATAAWVVGGAVGGSIGKHVTARRANGVNKATGHTIAVEQSLEDRATKEVDIRVTHEIDGAGTVEDITAATEARTDAEMMGNRKRVRTAAAVGAMAGKSVFKLKEFIDHRYRDPSQSPKTPTESKPEAPKTTDPAPKPPTEAAAPTPKPTIELIPTDDRLPWTHVTEVTGHNGTPDIFAAVEKGKSMGIDIVGEGRGLKSVTYNGVTYTDNGHINAALDYIMSN